MEQPLFLLATCLGAYLLGAIPSSVWIGKLFFGIDVREHGSGNAGATNTLRTLGKLAGFSVLGIDFLKGFVATSLVYTYGSTMSETEMLNMKILLGVMAVVGHIYPVFAGFRGGKGIATLIGVVTCLSWQLALCCFLLFLAIVVITKYISLGSVLSGLANPFFAAFLNHWQATNLVYFCAIIGILVTYTHRANIKRLLAGNENKFSLNKKPTHVNVNN